MKLIFATHNAGKVKEMRAMLDGLDIEVLSADEAGITEDVVEGGKTFKENAIKKARFVVSKSEWAVADDSGICIDALGGEPGVYSARWAGENVSAETLIARTLERLSNAPEEKRQACFVSTLVLCAPDARGWVFEGEARGLISTEPRGTPRPKLPYDVIFIPDGYNRTFAQMSDEEKNSLSHRGLAFRKLREFLSSL